jgi:hypothetical protein
MQKTQLSLEPLASRLQLLHPQLQLLSARCLALPCRSQRVQSAVHVCSMTLQCSLHLPVHVLLLHGLKLLLQQLCTFHGTFHFSLQQGFTFRGTLHFSLQQGFTLRLGCGLSLET